MFNAPHDTFDPGLSDFFQRAASEFLTQPESRAPYFCLCWAIQLGKNIRGRCSGCDHGIFSPDYGRRA